MSVRPPMNAPPTRPAPGSVVVSGGFPHPTKPIGILVLAMIIGVAGVLGIILGLLVVLSPAVNIGGFGLLVNFVNDNINNLGLLGGAIIFIGGIVAVSVANGLWHQEMWALVLCVGGTFVGETIIFFLAIPFSYLFFGLLVIFIYLLAVRKHFY